MNSINGLGYIGRVSRRLDKSQIQTRNFLSKVLLSLKSEDDDMNECVETLFTEHKAVKCQYHKCLGLRIHCLKKVD